MTSFLESQIRDNHLHSYRILRHSGNGNFKEMPEYQVICDYENEAELEKAFARMKPDRYKQGPHASLMTMVKEFRVSFSEDIAGKAG